MSAASDNKLALDATQHQPVETVSPSEGDPSLTSAPESPSSAPKSAESKISLTSHMPRPSSCCIGMTVFGIVIIVGVITYFSVWDNQKAVESWAQRFFASEKKLVEGDSTEWIMYDAGQWTYFIFLAVVFVINLTIVVPALIVVVRRRCRSTTKKLETLRSLKEKPSVDAIVPCYLPNEKEIIEETLWHILKNVESPGDFKLWLVYNTPTDMPEVEARLHAMAKRADLPNNRKLAVVRAEGSRSKAENINMLLPKLTAQYTVIYDADHHPDRESLMLLIEKAIRKNLACVQGSTYIRDLNSGMLARIIDAEFFVTHFVYFPCMRLLTRQAVFCGSNGLWQTQVLQGTSFDPAMQTEDIDVAVRMLLEQHRIDFCPEARSGELAPIGLGALLKQRTRWAIGWDQVSLQLFSRVFSADAKGMRKAAVAYVCWSRWWMQMVGLFAGIITPLLTFLQRFSPDFCHCGMATQLLQTCMFYFFLILFLGCMLEAVFQTRHRGCQSWIQVIFVGFFMGVGAFYIIFQAYLIIVSLFRIGTGTVGGWVVTARKAQTTNVLVQEPMDEEQAGGQLVVAACEEGRNDDLGQRSTSPLKMSL